jgi:hypothetical protein
MDPNEALAQLRDLLKVIDHDADATQVLADFAVTFDGLDTWLSRGGFLPTAWKDAR